MHFFNCLSLRTFKQSRFFFMLFSCIQFFNINAYGQLINDPELTVNLDKISLVSVFKLIEEKTDSKVAYSEDIINDELKIDAKFTNKKLSLIIQELSQIAGFEYKFNGNRILIKKLKKVEVKGEITDAETGEPLSYVTVSVIGTAKGTVTNENGYYIIDAYPTSVIRFSFIGYKTLTVLLQEKANDGKNLNLSLEKKSIFLTDVIVTSQKRTESQKDVPIALSNISSRFLENNAVETMASAMEYIPGVKVSEQSVLSPAYVIRGLTSDNLKISVNNRVSIFQDGISTSKQVEAYTELFDIDHIEVLKGPQGTLFGRSAQIGAIHLISNRPENETSGKISLGTGNYNQVRINGYFNIPLIENKLFARVAAIYNKRDGYVDNLSCGTLMGKNTVAVRASLKYLPGRNNSADFIFSYENDKMPGQAFKSGTFVPKGGNTSPYTFADMGTGNKILDKRRVYGMTGNFRQYFTTNFSFTAITGYRAVNGSSFSDSDGTVAQALDFDIDVDYNQFSQELRINYDGNRFSGFAGANYFYEYGNVSMLLTQDERSFFAMLSPMLIGKIPDFVAVPMLINGEPNLSVTLNPLTGQPLQNTHTERLNNDGAYNSAVDVFIDGSLSVTPKLKLTAGGRLIYENTSSFYRVDPSPGNLGGFLNKGSNNIFKPTDGLLTASKSYTGCVGRFVTQYDFSKEVTAYASWSKGRRPNVIQINADTTQYLRAEIVNNYETGIKNMLFNNRLLLNVSVFLYHYNNFQTSSYDPAGENLYTITDSGKATGKGVETESQFAVTKNLTMFANYAFIDARFDRLNSDGEKQLLAGNTFRLTPKHSGSAGISYLIGLGKQGSVSLNFTATYKSGYYFDDENTKGIYQNGYALLNSSVQYTPRNGRYGLLMYMHNITNERYLIDAGNTGLVFGIPTFIPGAPRFCGMQLFVNF